MKVSIITVSYNSERTIRQTIESVLNQTYPIIEYVIIDGKSRDGTMDIAREFEPKFDGRMKWVSESDRGIYDAMNKGISLATGELIGIINSDDWYESDAVETVVREHRKHPGSILYGLLRAFLNGREMHVGARNYRFLDTGMIPHPTCFVPKKLYDRYGGFDTRYRFAADYDLLLRAYQNRVPFVQINKILANFRKEGVSFGNLAMMIEFEQIRCEHGCISKWERDKEILKLKAKTIIQKLLRVSNLQ